VHVSEYLPNNMLTLHVLLLFSILNPLIIPFGSMYFCVEATVIRNQVIHVYAKSYEGNGRTILTRLVRYSLDGLMLSQAVFLAYMVVLKKTVNITLAAFLILFTIIVKFAMTRLCHAQYEDDDMVEAKIVCHMLGTNNDPQEFGSHSDVTDEPPRESDLHAGTMTRLIQRFRRLPLPAWINFSYSITLYRKLQGLQRQSNAMRQPTPFDRLGTLEVPLNDKEQSSSSNISTVLLKPLQLPPAGPLENPPKNPTSPPSSLVQNHPHPIAWDDESRNDIPYHNPNYIRAITDTLWLPQDPFGLVDLDDTVDLRVSLTTDPSTGDLNTRYTDDQWPLSVPALRYNGYEDIEPPVEISSRIADLENQGEVEKSELTTRELVLQEAIVDPELKEVMAEVKKPAEARLRERELGAHGVENEESWLTSWMYNKTQI